MGAYLVRRLLLMVPTLFGMTLVVFFIMAAAPGSTVDMIMSKEGEMQAGDRRARLRYFERRYGLGRPVVVQYGRWINKVSPLGFRTSDELTFDEDQEQEVREAIARRVDEAHVKVCFEAIRTMAQFQDEDLMHAANAFLDRMVPDPKSAFDLAEALGIDLIEQDPGDHASEREKARWRVTEALRHAQDKDVWPAATAFLEEELVGKSRVLFSKPAFKKPDMGESFYHRRPVWDLIGDALPITVLLNVMSLPLVYFLSIGMGVHAARHQGKAFDVWSGITLLGMWSIPTIWAGVMLRGFLANEQYFHWFPVSGLHDLNADAMRYLPHATDDGWQAGWLLDSLWHLMLPLICLSYAGFAFLAKLSRGAVLENLRADFVRTARAKGVGGTEVLWHHVFRNSLLPLITVAAFVIPGMLGGSVIVERIFSINGMGNLVVEAIFNKDKELVMAITLISGVLSMVAFLLADLLYTVADPRVSYE